MSEREPKVWDLPTRQGWEDVRLGVLSILLATLSHVVGSPAGFWLLFLTALVFAWSGAMTSDLYRDADRLARDAIDHTGEVIGLWKRDVEAIQRGDASWRN